MHELKQLIDAYALAYQQSSGPTWESREGKALDEALTRIKQERYAQGTPIGWALKDVYGNLHFSTATADEPTKDDYALHSMSGESFVEVFRRPPVAQKPLGVDDLAQEIRRVDGMHSLGAGALAEALMPFLENYASTGSPV